MEESQAAATSSTHGQTPAQKRYCETCEDGQVKPVGPSNDAVSAASNDGPHGFSRTVVIGLSYAWWALKTDWRSVGLVCLALGMSDDCPKWRRPDRRRLLPPWGR